MVLHQVQEALRNIARWGVTGYDMEDMNKTQVPHCYSN
jgi:hypothetical protein